MKDRAAAVIVRNGKILLMRRHREGRDYSSLPGGKIESPESPRDACIRELREETGLAVVIDRLVCAIDNQQRREYYFLVARFEGQPQLAGPELARNCPQNHYELQWVDATQLDEVNLLPTQVRNICRDLARQANPDTAPGPDAAGPDRP